MVDHGPGLHVGDTVPIRLTIGCSSAIGVFARNFFECLEGRLLGKGGFTLGYIFVDKEVIHVFGSISIFDVFCDILGSG